MQSRAENEGTARTKEGPRDAGGRPRSTRSGPGLLGRFDALDASDAATLASTIVPCPARWLARERTWLERPAHPIRNSGLLGPAAVTIPYVTP